MSITFDLSLSSLLPVLLGVTLTRFVVMGHYALHRKVYPGFRTFVLAEFCGLLSMGAVALRAWFGESLPLVFLSSFGTMLHPVIVYHGLGIYGRIPRLSRRTRQNMAVAALGCLAQLADLIIAPDMPRRVLIYSAVLFVLCLRTGIELPAISRRGQAGVQLLSFTFVPLALIHGLRAWNTYSAMPYDYAAMMLADRLLAMFLLYRILQSVLELYVVFSMNSLMLENDLRAVTAQVELMAQTDALTGALNRRGMELLGAEALRRAFSVNQPAAVIMLDLDHFKQVNDSRGHAAGDELLRALAALCAGALRTEDVFARYGGEEFVVVAPHTDLPQAALLSERMRLAIAEARFPVMGGAGVTVSIGVAGAREGDLETPLKSADAALYQAKQSGRNRVVVVTGQEGGPERFVAEEEA